MSVTLDTKWILNKEVSTSDGFRHRFIVGQTEKHITIIEGVWRRRKYMIPKPLVTSFDGSIVYLSIPENEMEKYLVK